MAQSPSGGLPPRIYVPIVLAAAVAFLGTIGYFLRIGLGVTGSALGPGASAPARQGDARIGAAAVPPVATRGAGEAAVPQSGGAPTAAQGALPPGNPVGGGGPAAGPPAAVERALTRLRARLARNPRDREALVALASLYAAAHKDAEATRLYAQAVALDPHDPDVRASYAVVLHDDGKDLAALQQIELALRTRPDFTPALFDEGLIAAAAGHRAEAASAFRRFLELAPDDPRAADARAALHDLAGPSS